MVLEDQINSDIKNRLSEHRYNHSIGVMKMAELLAKHYGLDVKKARLAGIAHDIAKQMKVNEISEYIEKYNIKLDDVERNNKELIHAIIGADICAREYGFDEEMVNAVRFHTTGRRGMTLFEKIIFIADKVEETRDYDDIEERRRLSFDNIDIAIIKTLDYTITDCIKRKMMIHPNSIDARNSLLKR